MTSSWFFLSILICETLTGIYEGCYTYVFEMCFYRTLDIVIYYFINSNNIYNNIQSSNNNASLIQTCNLLHMYRLKVYK